MRFLYGLVVIAFLDTFVQLPIIAPYAQDMGASSFLIGSIIAVYSFTNIIGNALGGHWIDRYGRKKVLLLGLASTVIVLLFYPYASTGSELFTVRFFHGFAGGILIPAVFTYVTDITSSKGRKSGKSMAYTGACIGTAAIIGPAMGGVISSTFGVQYVFYIVATIFTIFFILSIILLKESFALVERRNVKISDFKYLFKNPLLIQASLSSLTIMASMGILTYALPLKVEALSYSSAITGGLISSFGIAALIIFLTPINTIYDTQKPQHLILLGLLFVIMSLLILNYVTAIGLILLFMITYGIGFALIFPSMNRMIVDLSKKQDRGKAFGIFFGAFSLGIVLGSFVTGLVEEFHLEPFLAGSAFILLLTVILGTLVKRNPGKAVEE